MDPEYLAEKMRRAEAWPVPDGWLTDPEKVQAVLLDLFDAARDPAREDACPCISTLVAVHARRLKGRQ